MEDPREKLEFIHAAAPTDLTNDMGDGEAAGVERVYGTNTDDEEVAENALGTHLPKNYWRSPGFVGTVVALCLGNMASFIGSVMPQTSLTAINESIGPSPDYIWVATGWGVGFAVGFMLLGRLSDIFGRRYFLIGGNLLCVVASIIAATAHSMGQLIAGSVLIGVGTTAQYAFVVAITELVPNKDRTLWVGFIFLAPAPIACFGPVIAQKFATATALGWRWDYYLCLITSGLATILLLCFYFPPSFQMLHRRTSKRQQLMRFDYVGTTLFTGGLTLFLMGINWGGSSYPWRSAHVITTIVVGFCSIIACGLYGNYLYKGDPFIPMSLFRRKGYLALVLTAMVGSCVYYSMNVLWPLEIIHLFPGSPTHNGLVTGVLGSSVMIGQVTAGPILRYLRVNSKYLIIMAAILLTTFCGAMISVEPGQKSRAIGLIFIAGWGVGLIETCSISLAPLTCPPEELGTANGVLVVIRNSGASAATAIFTTILTNKLSSFTPRMVSNAAIAAGLPKSSLPTMFEDLTTGNFTGARGINPTIIAAVGAAQAQAAADSFRYVWYAVIAFGCVSIIAACCTINYSVYETGHVARKLHGRLAGNPEKSDVPGLKDQPGTTV